MRLFREFEFRTLIDRLPPLTGESAVDAAEALRSAAGTVPAARVAGATGSSAAPAPAGGSGAGAWTRRPAAAARSLIGEGEGLQLTMDFGSTGLAAPAPAPAPLPSAARARAVGRSGGRPVDLAAALRAAVADPTLLDRFDATEAEAADAATGWRGGTRSGPRC